MKLCSNQTPEVFSRHSIIKEAEVFFAGSTESRQQYAAVHSIVPGGTTASIPKNNGYVDIGNIHSCGIVTCSLGYRSY